MARNKAHSRTDRGTNWSKMRNDVLNAILNDPYTRGLNGEDYEPYREELQAEQWARAERAEAERMAQHERDQKLYMKHLATSHKRQKATA